MEGWLGPSAGHVAVMESFYEAVVLYVGLMGDC